MKKNEKPGLPARATVALSLTVTAAALLLTEANALPTLAIVAVTPRLKGQTEAVLDLPPGDYKLTLQFADGLHRSYGKDLSATINIKVASK